jgi:hypothetical protein
MSNLPQSHSYASTANSPISPLTSQAEKDWPRAPTELYIGHDTASIRPLHARRACPRGILRNSVAATCRSPLQYFSTEQEYLNSSNNDASPTAPSVPQLNARCRALATPRITDAEADKLARACGDGPFSPTSPTLFLETSAFATTRTPVRRTRAQSVSDSRSEPRSSAVRPPSRRSSCQRAQIFPHPPSGHILRSLKRVLHEETKGFKIHDYIEVEDLMSGRLWEDEDELLVDCVRDRADDDSGHDGVWRRERRARRLSESVQRAIHLRDGSTLLLHAAHARAILIQMVDVFGSQLQDLPERVMVPVLVGGYKHYVPEVVDACIDDLYRTGEHDKPA